MRREDDADDLEAELPGIGVRSEMRRVDCLADRLGYRPPQFTLAGDERVPDGARAIVVFAGCGKHEAATRLVALQPRKPIREEAAKPGQAGGLGQRRCEHCLLEEALHLLERENLKIFLGAEVREEAALRKTQTGGERAYGQALETDLARESESLIEDQRSCPGSFAHMRMLVRTFVCVKYPAYSAH